MKRRTKLLSVLLTLTMGVAAIGFAACDDGKSEGRPLQSPSQSSAQSPSTPSSAPADDPAESYFSEGLEYTLSNDETYYTVSGIGTCTDTDIVMPSTYNSLPVTSIGAEAFAVCHSLTSVTIPDSVTSIGEDAFYGCYKLVEVYNKSSLEITAGSADNGYVGYNAKNVYTPTSGTSKLSTDSDGYIIYTDGEDKILIGYTGNETELTLPSDITGIYQCAFYKCSSLTSITIPDSVTSIGDHAFYYCDSLTSITIPDSVTSIGEGTFSHCSKLTSITIPNSVTSIDWYAFYYCSSLESITIPDGVTSIGGYAFYYCDSLTSITIPDSVTSIGKGTFSHCSKLTSITIPDSVTSIGQYAFYGCSNLPIYCEAESKPDGWDSSWNPSDCPVVWGYTGEN